MRFRPLCIDYHAEAFQLEEEERRLAGRKRPVICIQNYHDNGNLQSSVDTEIATDDGSWNGGLDHGIVNLENDESRLWPLKNDDFCATNDDQNTITITPTPFKKQRRQWLENDPMKDDNSYVAIFKPPMAFLKLVEDDSPVTKKSSKDETPILPFGDLVWQEGYAGLSALQEHLEKHPNKPQRTRNTTEFFAAVYESPWLLKFVSSIRRQVNRKRIMEHVSSFDPRTLVLGVVSCNPVSNFLREQAIDKMVFVQVADACSKRYERAFRIWNNAYGRFHNDPAWEAHHLPLSHRSLCVEWGLVSSNGVRLTGSFGKLVLQAGFLHRQPTRAQVFLEHAPSYMRYLSSKPDSSITTGNLTMADACLGDGNTSESLWRSSSNREPESPSHTKPNGASSAFASYVKEGRDIQIQAPVGSTACKDHLQNAGRKATARSKKDKKRSSRTSPTHSAAKRFWGHLGGKDTETFLHFPPEEENAVPAEDSPGSNQESRFNARQNSPILRASDDCGDQGGDDTFPGDPITHQLGRSKKKETYLLEKFGLSILNQEKSRSSRQYDKKMCSDAAAKEHGSFDAMPIGPQTVGNPEICASQQPHRCSDSDNLFRHAGVGVDPDPKIKPENSESSQQTDDFAHCKEESSVEWYPDVQDDISDHDGADEGNGIPLTVPVTVDHTYCKRKRSKSKKSKKKSKKKEKRLRKRRKQTKKKEEDGLETPRKLDFRNLSPVKSPHKDMIDDVSQPEWSLEVVNDGPGCAHSEDVGDEAAVAREQNHQPPKAIIANDTTSSKNDLIYEQEDKLAQMPSEGLPLRLLCSEKFLEAYGNVVADLAKLNLFDAETNRIQLVDTPLMTTVGVDIEVPQRGAFVVYSVSQTRRFSNEVLGRITNLAGSSRYDWIEFFLCIDEVMDDTTSQWMTRLQKALLVDEGFLGTKIRFTITSMASLSKAIGYSIVSLYYEGPFITEHMEQCLSDVKILNRLNFLLVLIPSLSATGALVWLEAVINPQTTQTAYEKQVAIGFNRLFADSSNEAKRLVSLQSSNKQVRREVGPDVAFQFRLLANMNGHSQSGAIR